jgi:hypothetical protein
MINNNAGCYEGDINYLIIDYLKQQNFNSNSEKEEIIMKVYIFFNFIHHNSIAPK